jgi:hypothetical protein
MDGDDSEMSYESKLSNSLCWASVSS